MPVLMSTKEFEEECAQRRIDYAKLFEPRVTPQWLLKFEEQVLDECRKEMAALDLPTQVEFERRLTLMNEEREILESLKSRNERAAESTREILNAISAGVRP